MLRDDKTYPYIYFTSDHDFPAVYLKRTKAVDKNYFGPFVSAEAVKKSIKKFKKFLELETVVITLLQIEQGLVLSIR